MVENIKVVEKKEVFLLSYLGESYVRLELAKMGYKVLGTTPGFFFDLLGEDGKKIEVKTATPSTSTSNRHGNLYQYKQWQFRLSSPKQATNPDFYVCVLINNVKDPPIGYFIFPKDSIETYAKDRSGIISIFESDLEGKVKMVNKLNRHQYLNKWGLITEKKINS